MLLDAAGAVILGARSEPDAAGAVILGARSAVYLYSITAMERAGFDCLIIKTSIENCCATANSS